MTAQQSNLKFWSNVRLSIYLSIYHTMSSSWPHEIQMPLPALFLNNLTRKSLCFIALSAFPQTLSPVLAFSVLRFPPIHSPYPPFLLSPCNWNHSPWFPSTVVLLPHAHGKTPTWWHSGLSLPWPCNRTTQGCPACPIPHRCINGD